MGTSTASRALTTKNGFKDNECAVARCRLTRDKIWIVMAIDVVLYAILDGVNGFRVNRVVVDHAQQLFGRHDTNKNIDNKFPSLSASPPSRRTISMLWTCSR